jgi:hypothetical protein
VLPTEDFHVAQMVNKLSNSVTATALSRAASGLVLVLRVFCVLP